jgi:hypothetical protein
LQQHLQLHIILIPDSLVELSCTALSHNSQAAQVQQIQGQRMRTAASSRVAAVLAVNFQCITPNPVAGRLQACGT